MPIYLSVALNIQIGKTLEPYYHAATTYSYYNKYLISYMYSLFHSKFRLLKVKVDGKTENKL